MGELVYVSALGCYVELYIGIQSGPNYSGSLGSVVVFLAVVLRRFCAGF